MAREILSSSDEDRFQRHRGELQRLLEEYKTADAKEKNELRDRIQTLEDKIEEDKRAKEQKEKDEGTGGTLVLPPDQAPQGQHHGDDRGQMQHSDMADASDGGQRKGKWKKAW